MKRKGFWAVAAVLACGALVYLTVSVAAQPQAYSKADFDGFRGKITEKRQALATWLNTGSGDLKEIIAEKAVAINPRGRGVGHGRVKIEDKWKRIKAEHGNQKVSFDIATIEILPAKFMTGEDGAAWTSFDLIGIEFGAFTFATVPEAMRGPSAGLPKSDGEYWAIWGHKQNCPWEILYEIEY